MGMNTLHSNAKILGVNGFGRIGKLTLWHHVGRKYFDDIIININHIILNGENYTGKLIFTITVRSIRMNSFRRCCKIR